MPVSSVDNKASTSAAPREPSRASQTYSVKRGDNLTHIAKDHKVSLQEMKDANPQLRDPNKLRVGQELNLPGGAATPPTPSQADGQYLVQRGDTMSGIAQSHGVGLSDLVNANPQVRDPNTISVGQQLNIPGAAGNGASHATRGHGERPADAPIVHGGVSTEMMRARVEGDQPVLSRGANGAEVQQLQGRLSELGFRPGPADGDFGPRTQEAVRAFQRSQSLAPDGVVGPQTHAALQSPDTDAIAEANRPYTPGDYPRMQVYEPGSREQVALFEEAARRIGVPESWASSRGLQNILRRESNGRVGVPNYTYGDRARDPSRWGEIHDELRSGRITARSSATGLGQLLLSNVDRHYPDGRAGIGDPVNEAAGMLSYIRDRYGNPDNAWSQYGVHHEGY